MPNDNLSGKIDRALKEMERTDRQRSKHQPAPEQESDPVVAALIAKGLKAMEELDPIVRETYRDDPATLAEWDDIMRMRDNPPEDDATQAEDTSLKKE
ncbi:MAG: hypothetical protein QOC96_1158 [Acidobacteriota bacterium]|jgi:hypothetical protein|nr:hypothetical protein [Acidobacteriota bacterium]